jgi:hypothetical protein
MGSLVSFFNYLQHRLADAPFDLAPALVALVFLLYVFGALLDPRVSQQVGRGRRPPALALPRVLGRHLPVRARAHGIGPGR